MIEMGATGDDQGADGTEEADTVEDVLEAGERVAEGEGDITDNSSKITKARKVMKAMWYNAEKDSTRPKRPEIT